MSLLLIDIKSILHLVHQNSLFCITKKLLFLKVVTQIFDFYFFPLGVSLFSLTRCRIIGGD